MHLHIAHRVSLVDVLQLDYRTRFWPLHQVHTAQVWFCDFLNCLHDLLLLRLTKSSVLSSEFRFPGGRLKAELQTRYFLYRPRPPPPVLGALPNPGAEPWLVFVRLALESVWPVITI